MRLRRRSSAPEDSAPLDPADSASAARGTDDDAEDTLPLDVATLRDAGPSRSAGEPVAAPEPAPAPAPAPEPEPEPEPDLDSEPDLEPDPDLDLESDLVARDAPDPEAAGQVAAATRLEDPDETVRAARRRFARRQRRRRWLAWRRLVIAVLVAGVLVATVWLVFFSSVLAVSGVQVEGTEVLSAATVRRTAAVPTGGPLATADLDAVAARVKDLPAVKDVDVSRAWPDRVRVDVTERTPVAVVLGAGQGGTLRATDADGVVFRSYASRPVGLPLIRTGTKASTDALAEAATVAGSLPPRLAAKVADVTVSTVDTIDLRLKSGKRVRWGSAGDSVDKARVLEVLLGQRASFYDVSVPGQPVIRR